jgi:hypothetical protein
MVAVKENCGSAPRAPPILLFDLIILTVFGEQYRSWSSSLCTFYSLPEPHFTQVHNVLFPDAVNRCSALAETV